MPWTTPTRNNGGFFRKTTTTGLALLLFLSILPGCAARHMPDWSRVQVVPLQTKAEVQLYKDEAPQGSRKIQGHLHLATTDSITLALKDGQTRTLEKSAVRKVRTRRPFLKRWPGWVALGVGPRSKSDVGSLNWNLTRSRECSVLYSSHGSRSSFFPFVGNGKDLRSPTSTPDAPGRRPAVRC